MITQNESQFEQGMSQDDEGDNESDDSSRTTEENDNMDEENQEDEEDGEDDDDDDDDDEEDEDEESPFGDDNDDYQDVEDAIFRFPLNDDHDDIDLMIHYPDSDHQLQHTVEPDRSRAITLPLWSDVGNPSGPDTFSLGGNGSATSGTTTHVTPTHPLLMGRQPGMETGSSSRTGGGTRTLQRHRGNGGIRIHLNSRLQGNPSAPAILQNFLGSPQDLIQQGLRRGTPLLVDFGFAILDQLTEGTDLPDLDSGGVLGGGGRAALSSIPSALVRWNEESRVIDGDSVHDCVTACKPEILKVVHQQREEEITDRKAKRRKQQEEEEAAAAAAAAVAAASSAASSAPEVTPTPSENQQKQMEESASETIGEDSSSPPREDAAPVVSARSDVPVAIRLTEQSEQVTSQPPSQTATDQAQDQAETEAAPTTTTSAPPAVLHPAALAPLSPSPENVSAEVSNRTFLANPQAETGEGEFEEIIICSLMMMMIS